MASLAVDWGEEDVVLPRQQRGFQPQHLLLTLLGDYWFRRDEHLPSAALVRLLAEFRISPASVRAALSRLSRRGLLTSSKSGRRTYYGPSPQATKLLAEGRQHILTFGTRESAWDGAWTLAVFSIPERERHIRHVLRARLRWLGFAPLYDGVWVSPHKLAEAAKEVLTELGVEMATIVVGEVVPGGLRLGNPIEAWDLEELRGHYEGFLDEFTPLLDRMRAGQVGASEAFVSRTALMDAWRNFPNLDPELPPALLPDQWPRAAARTMFIELYDGLGSLAEVRVRQILREFDPELARVVTHHTTADLEG
ncbi:MAG: PaaX family transcriptional regulator [Streptosporangiales bacterium]|nr:PaaX family transcriptional regulator [Streptosporangiales bacterium]